MTLYSPVPMRTVQSSPSTRRPRQPDTGSLILVEAGTLATCHRHRSRLFGEWAGRREGLQGRMLKAFVREVVETLDSGSGRAAT
jgi:hypothetical protein